MGLKRILILGVSPLPTDSDGILQGAGIRTWQFIKPLLQQSDVAITAVCLRTDDPEKKGDSRVEEVSERLARYDVSQDTFQNDKKMRKLLGDEKPLAVIGVGSILPVYVASRLAGASPMWADFFGDPLAEIQSKAEIYPEEKSREEIFHVWKLYNAILHRADKFSAVSEPQRHAIIGHLGFAGRLNRFTCGYEFVHAIPCGVDEDAEDAPADSANLARPDNAPALPEDAFVVRWSGSYNTWADTKTLLAALNRAMESSRNIYFLSTGGGTAGYNEKVYDEFVQSVAESKFRERFVLRGWVPNDEVPYWDSQSHLGINVDRFTYEGVLGSRNRVIQFLRIGVPVLTTQLSEVTKTLAHRGLVQTFSIADANDLAGKLLKLADEKESLKMQVQKAREFVLSEYAFSRTLEACIKWIEQAGVAPDNAGRKPRSPEPETGAKVFLNEAEHWSHYNTLQKEYEYLLKEKSFLDSLRKTLPYKLLQKVKRLFKR